MRKSLVKKNPFVEEEIEDVWLKATYTEREPLGEERFALRILVNGIAAIVEPTLCVVHNRASHTGGKYGSKANRTEPMLVRQQEALEWILGEKTNYPFQAVCNALKLDEERMREALLMKVERLKRRVPQIQVMEASRREVQEQSHTQL